MALTYLQTKTGKVVDALEPQEARGKKRQQIARRTIEKMDRSKKWVRLSDPAEIAKARQAWEAKKSRTRQSAERPPTPVYVVNQAPPEPEPEPEPTVDVSGPPAQTDPKAAWVAYAETQGADDAESLTKADLIELYG